MLGLWLRCALLVLCSFPVLSRGEGLTPQEWKQRLLSQDLTILQSQLIKAKQLGRLSEAGFTAASDLAAVLRLALSKAELTPAGYRAQSLRYLALTDMLTLIPLGELCAGRHCPNELSQSANELTALVRELKADFPESEEATILNRIRQVEQLAQAAQKSIIQRKQHEAMDSLILRFESLELLGQPVAVATATLREGSELLLAGDAEAAQGKVTEALQVVFGDKALHWDGRHLYQLLQLRLLSLAVAKSALVSQADRARITAEFSTVESARDQPAYTAASGQLQKTLQGLIELHRMKETEPDLASYVTPEAVRASVEQRLAAMKLWAVEAEKYLLANETLLQGLGTRRYELRTMLGNMQAQLYVASTQIARTNRQRTVHGFNQSFPFFQLVTSYTVEAILDRSDAAPKYLKVWQQGLANLMKGETFLSAAEQRELRSALKIERREGIRNAWLNRRNATVAAMSVLLAAEAVSIPFTGGGSAAAMPATLAAITTVSVVSAKTVLLASSALNIGDRAKVHGVMGLANTDTAFDVMILLSLSPRPTVGGPAATTTMGKLTQYGARHLAQFQYSSATLLSVAGPAYGGYLVYNAESIAKEMNKDGILVSADDVRRRGLINVALGMLAYGTNAAYYKQGVKQNGAAFEKEIAGGTFVGGTLKNWGNKLNQVGAIRDYRAANPGTWGAVKTTALGAGYVAFDFLLGTEAMLLSFTNLDSNYLDHMYAEKPLPDLKDGESAVLLIGFDPADYLLWAGARARYSHRREYEKYGDKLQMYDYKSPDDLMAVLAEHRRLHGPIRFVKIATHGRPGMLYTREVWGSPEEKLGGGWINGNYLNGNKASLQRLAREIFAPDVRFLLWACLVGTNLDEAADGHSKKAGEEFLSQLGDVLLVNGGRVDASTRVLIGLEATLGVAGDYMQKEGFRVEKGQRPRRLLPVTPLPRPGGFILAMDGGGEGTGESPATVDEAPSPLSVGKTMARRLWSIYSDLPPVWWKYGINLEGPHWQSPYYRSLEVAPH